MSRNLPEVLPGISWFLSIRPTASAGALVCQTSDFKSFFPTNPFSHRGSPRGEISSAAWPTSRESCRPSTRATRRPPPSCCRSSTTSCGSSPPPRLAAEKPGQTLQATALVHEAYLRLVGERAGAGLERPRALLRRRRRGHAPHPRRGRPPQAAAQARRRPPAARPRRLDRADGADGPGRRPARPGRGPRPASPERPAQGRAGQAPVLRRADRSRRRPPALGISPATAKRDWAVRPGLAVCGAVRRPKAGE